MSAIAYVLAQVALLFAAVRARFPALVSWLRQTSTILGFATAVGIIAAVLQGTMGWDVAVPGLAGALVSVLMPGHPDVETAARRAALDAVLLVQRDPRFPGMVGFASDVATGLSAVEAVRAAPPVDDGHAT
ncbi:MAG TPA: hypothetical protein VGC15_06760 [Acetobacteraceae bacterium]